MPRACLRHIRAGYNDGRDEQNAQQQPEPSHVLTVAGSQMRPAGLALEKEGPRFRLGVHVKGHNQHKQIII